MIFKKTTRLGAFLYIALIVLPVFFLLADAELKIDMLSSRQMGLLLNTFSLSFVLAIFSVLVGFYSALYIKNSRLANTKLRWLFLLMLALPKYIYALSFMYGLKFIQGFLGANISYLNRGFLPVLIVELMIFLPVSTGIILISLENIDDNYIDAGLLYMPYNDLIYEVILPSVAPALLFSFFLIFALSSTDFSVPALFQYNVYAMDILSEFSATGMNNSLLPSLVPLILVNFVLLIFMIRNIPISILEFPESRGRVHKLKSFSLFIAFIAFFVLVIQAIVPLMSILLNMGGFNTVKTVLKDFSSEYFYSTLIAFFASALAIFLSSLAFNYYIHIKSKVAAKIYIFICVFIISLPATFTSIGFIGIINSSFLHGLSGSIFPPILGLSIRLMPLCFAFILALVHNTDKEFFEVGKLYAGSGFLYFKTVLVPVFIRAYIGLFIFTFLLALGDVDASVILAAAGKTPISISIFNYLHYGESVTVATQSFVLLMVNLLIIVLFGLFIKFYEKN